MYKKLLACTVALLPFIGIQAQNMLDRLDVRNNTSESAHNLIAEFSNIVTGQSGLNARTLNLRTDTLSYNNIYGGNMVFTMAVNPAAQNYFTVKFSGNEFNANDGRIILAIDNPAGEWREVGRRSGADESVFSEATYQPITPNAFYYRTILIPKKLVGTRTKVRIKLRATGRYYAYGTVHQYETFQRQMVVPSRGIYDAYTHTNPIFNMPADEIQGKVKNYQSAPKRTDMPYATYMAAVKYSINGRIGGLLSGPDYQALYNNNNYNKIEYLAYGYVKPWSTYYQSSTVVKKVIRMIDAQAASYYADNLLLNAWGGAYGRLGRAIQLLYPQLADSLDVSLVLNGVTTTRRQHWITLLKLSFEYALNHRRTITNQEMECIFSMYSAHKGLQLIDPTWTLTETKAKQFVYESMGLAEWRGDNSLTLTEWLKDITKGFQYGFGRNYFMMTLKGTSHEPGWVSQDCYGNLGRKMYEIYTVCPDSLILDLMVRHEKIQAHFCYPMIDDEGYRAIVAEGPICWRNNYHPGRLRYGNFGVAAASLDPELLGYQRQMRTDGQFYFNSGDVSTTPYESLHLFIPEIVDTLLAHTSSLKNPSLPDQPDFVTSDEENGIVSIKRGEERLFVTLYKRAYTINRLAMAHQITPEFERVVEFYEDDVRYTPSGNQATGGSNVQNSGTGTVPDYPIYYSSGDVFDKPSVWGNEPGFSHDNRAIADFYAVQYGNYFIAMNTTGRGAKKDFMANIPSGYAFMQNVATGAISATGLGFMVKSGTTAVYYLMKSANEAYQKNVMPGIIEAETFDIGASGKAWSDSDPKNNGGCMRLEGADIYAEDDSLYLSDIASGEWLKYTLTANLTGTYKFHFRYKSSLAGGTALLVMNGDSIGSGLVLPYTAGAWKTVTYPDSVDLTKGTNQLQVFFPTGGFSLNYINSYLQFAPFEGVTSVLPGTVWAERFDEGGQDLAYHATQTTTRYAPRNEYLNMAGYDDSGVTRYVVSGNTGEWVYYSVHVEKADSFLVVFWAGAKRSTGAKFSVFIDEKDVTGTISLSTTGSLTKFGSYTFKTNLTAGKHRIKVLFNSLQSSLQKFVFTAMSDTLVSIMIPDKQVQRIWCDNGLMGIFSPEEGTQSWRLLTLEGIICKTGKLQDNQAVLDVSDLKKGIYLLQIVSGQNKTIHKIQIRYK